MAVILRESRRAWEALDSNLQAKGAGPVQGEWTASAVYAHLGRWLERATADVRQHLDGGEAPPPVENEDAANDRWAKEDATLPVAEARERCARAFEAMHGMLAELDPEHWDETVLQVAEDDAWNHLRVHLHAIGGTDPD